MTNTIIGKVINTSPLNGSMYGNPRYQVTLETSEGDVLRLKTMHDAGIAYAIANPEFRDEWHEFTLTRAGNIRSAQKVELVSCRN